MLKSSNNGKHNSMIYLGTGVKIIFEKKLCQVDYCSQLTESFNVISVHKGEEKIFCQSWFPSVDHSISNLFKAFSSNLFPFKKVSKFIVF